MDVTEGGYIGLSGVVSLFGALVHAGGRTPRKQGLGDTCSRGTRSAPVWRLVHDRLYTGGEVQDVGAEILTGCHVGDAGDLHETEHRVAGGVRLGVVDRRAVLTHGAHAQGHVDVGELALELFEFVCAERFLPVAQGAQAVAETGQDVAGLGVVVPALVGALCRCQFGGVPHFLVSLFSCGGLSAEVCFGFGYETHAFVRPFAGQSSRWPWVGTCQWHPRHRPVPAGGVKAVPPREGLYF
jgi:hypothetical protein